MGYVEKVTVGGKSIIFDRPCKPVDVESIEGDEIKLLLYDVTDKNLVPTNYDKPEGTPMALLKAGNIRVDLSKRTKEEMSFWHRSMDFHELIICIQGSITWETELGKVKMKPGQMLLIPKGIAHRSIPGKEGQENIIIELKIWSSSIDEIVPGKKLNKI